MRFYSSFNIVDLEHKFTTARLFLGLSQTIQMKYFFIADMKITSLLSFTTEFSLTLCYFLHRAGVQPPPCNFSSHIWYEVEI